jgi:hypothetical protein
MFRRLGHRREARKNRESPEFMAANMANWID